MSDRELDLAQKLLETLHLSVAERQELPGSRVPFSLLVRAAGQALSQSGWLPASQRPADDFTGVLIEARGKAYWIHERHEIGVGRLSPVHSREVQQVADAVRARINDLARTELDGIPIDWAL